MSSQNLHKIILNELHDAFEIHFCLNKYMYKKRVSLQIKQILL